MKRTDEICCPFYIQTRKNEIICEGIRGVSDLRLGFKSQSDLLNYARDMCKSIQGCQKCIIHKVIWGDWAE